MLHAGARPDDQREPGGPLDLGRGHLRRADDEDLRARLARGVAPERLALELRLVEDLAAAALRAPRAPPPRTCRRRGLSCAPPGPRTDGRTGRSAASARTRWTSGGIVAPASAIAMSSESVVGTSRRRPRRVRTCTRSSSSVVPRIPPTKSMRGSVRGSPMPRMGARSRSCRTETSSEEIGSLTATGSRWGEACHVPSKNMRNVPRRDGSAAGAGATGTSLSTAFKNLARRLSRRGPSRPGCTGGSRAAGPGRSPPGTS